MAMMRRGGSGRGGSGRGGGAHGPMGRMMKGDKAKDFKGSMKKLFQYLSMYKTSIITAIIIAIASTTASIVGPKILGNATTKLFEGLVAKVNGTGDIDFDAIGTILLTVLFLYVFSAIAAYIQGWIMANVSTDISYRLRRDISHKINKNQLKYYDRVTQGEVMSRITNDIDTINQTLSQSITQIITSIITVIGILVMMFSISWIMTLVALIIIPLSGVTVAIVVKRSQKHFTKQQEYIGHVNGHVEEMFGGHLVIKAFNGEESSMQKFDEFNDELYDSAWKSAFYSGLMMPIMNFIGNLGYVAVAILGGWLTIKNKISVGDIQAFIQYVRSFNQPIAQLANISNVLQQTAAAAERVFEFLEETEDVPETLNPVKVEKVRGDVEFKNVNFAYSPENPVIHDFSATIKAGQTVAIVGPTGAGKTTIVKLLMRFYELNGGSIYVDGNEITSLSRYDLRNKFGMVLQDTWLFNGTVLENIRYGRLDASDAEVIAAAEAAHADHFIDTLPGGYHMEINEEVTNISEGQKQLLTIARAVLANPDMLILDEATSSVDTRTEILIQRAMKKLMEKRTSFVIAHRLSTIRDADLILVMNEGDIVEQGTHKELLDNNGFYADLYNSQFDIINE
ncbi:MAG: ABC transporter ATP-binding protein [Candidatus Heimdallarchaeota archaeon]|nr:ABC transporter ATP-binding protein [Candidatus Heimdallarchaeota archaeon]